MSPESSTGVSPVLTPPASARVSAFLNLTLIVAAAYRIGQFIAQVPIAARFQYDYEEGNILNALSRILHGATPYGDPKALPNIINPYGPMAYYLLAVPVRLFGVAFIYPRLMIVAATVLIALFIGLELRRTTRSTTLALSFALVFLTIPNVEAWAWLLRVDLLGIAFTAAGLVWFSSVASKVERKLRPQDLVIPALFLASALLVKPTLVAAAAACFFSLLAYRRFRAAAALTVITAAACAVVIGSFAIITHGAIIFDLFLSHPDPFSFAVYTQGLTKALVTSWPLTALAVVAIARDLGDRRFSPSVLWLLFATVTAMTAGKLGSNQNHFLEWDAALCLAAGLGLHELSTLSGRKIAVTTRAVAIGVVALVIWRQPGAFVDLPAERGCPAAYDWVRTKAGPDLLSENVGALVLGNKKVWVSNPFVLAQLAEHAGWSDADLVAMVREHRFDAIITRMEHTNVPYFLEHGGERFSPEMLHAMRDNYTPEPGFDCSDMKVIYRPKSPPAIQSK